MGRFGRTEELVGAAVYLASDAASFTAGEIMSSMEIPSERRQPMREERTGRALSLAAFCRSQGLGPGDRGFSFQTRWKYPRCRTTPGCGAGPFLHAHRVVPRGLQLKRKRVPGRIFAHCGRDGLFLGSSLWTAEDECSPPCFTVPALPRRSALSSSDWRVGLQYLTGYRQSRGCTPPCGFYGLPFDHIPVTAANKEDAEREQIDLLQRNTVELVVLARYMQVLSPEFVAHYPTRSSTRIILSFQLLWEQSRITQPTSAE